MEDRVLLGEEDLEVEGLAWADLEDLAPVAVTCLEEDLVEGLAQAGQVKVLALRAAAMVAQAVLEASRRPNSSRP